MTVITTYEYMELPLYHEYMWTLREITPLLKTAGHLAYNPKDCIGEVLIRFGLQGP